MTSSWIKLSSIGLFMFFAATTTYTHSSSSMPWNLRFCLSSHVLRETFHGNVCPVLSVAALRIRYVVLVHELTFFTLSRMSHPCGQTTMHRTTPEMHVWGNTKLKFTTNLGMIHQILNFVSNQSLPPTSSHPPSSETQTVKTKISTGSCKRDVKPLLICQSYTSSIPNHWHIYWLKFLIPHWWCKTKRSLSCLISRYQSLTPIFVMECQATETVS